LETGFDDQQILTNLPPNDAEFLMSLSQNEFFILGVEREEISNHADAGTLYLLSNHVYRVQKISNKPAINIFFRHHLETRVDDKQMGGEMLSKSIGRLIMVQNIKKLFQLNPVKLKLNVLGDMQLG
jgi:hypothetical protein